MRAALYARFSTELQRRESIEDQLRACRAWCVKSGLEVVAEYEDAAISGASMANRPGLKALVADAHARRFDVVVTEALDRLSRSQGDVATLFEDLRYMGVGIRTIWEGEIEEMAVGLKGTMNALLLREIGRKTRRGMVGVAQAGRHAGGRTYGYRINREIDDKGEYVAGMREIDPAEADVVREVFTGYAAGFSPRTIAADLNRRALPSPRGGPGTPPRCEATPREAMACCTTSSTADASCGVATTGPRAARPGLAEPRRPILPNG